jgi:hypothetical protein
VVREIRIREPSRTKSTSDGLIHYVSILLGQFISYIVNNLLIPLLVRILNIFLVSVMTAMYFAKAKGSSILRCHQNITTLAFCKCPRIVYVVNRAKSWFSLLWAVIAVSTTRLFINLRGMSRQEGLEKPEIPIIELLSRSQHRGGSVERVKIQDLAIHVVRETA